MGIYRHIPGFPLNQYVDFLWYYVDFFPDHDREHVLPDGTFELILNLQDTPRRLFKHGDTHRHSFFKRGWFSGAHSKYIVIDALQNSSMIGAHFKPGGAAPFLGLPAGELTDSVIELDGVWGNDVWAWRDRLLACANPTTKFRVFEELLTRKLQRAGGAMDQRPVAWAVSRYMAEPRLQTITSVSKQVGFSHKHFIELFRRQTGLTPKLFCRIRRFQKVLEEIHAGQSVNWAGTAHDCGYFDQSHFVHDFLHFSGMNPSSYLDQRLEGERNFVRARPLR